MAKSAESHELLTLSKNAQVTLNHYSESGSPTKSPAATPPAISDSDAESLDKVTRIRKIFDFSLLFRFSLTFMST